MKQKLLELTEMLKQKPEIKERLESYTWHLECYELLIGYHDVLEYLGEDYYMRSGWLLEGYNYTKEAVSLSPGPLSDQTDETLDDIISLLKTVGKNK